MCYLQATDEADANVVGRVKKVTNRKYLYIFTDT